MTFPLMKRMKAQVAMTGILTKEIFEEKIRNASSICIIGHVSPDGDCAGSVLGAYNYIKNMRGDDMDVVPYLEELNEKFSFLSGYDAVRSERDDRRYDLAVVCDCADPDRMGRFLKLFREAKDSAVIDHHITNQGFGAHSIVEGTASSASEVLFGLMDEAYFDKAIAECIYTGIVHDTGVFRHSSTHKSTMEIAGKCIEKGIDFGSIIEESFFAMTFEQKKLLGYLLLNLRQEHGGKLVYSYISMEERKRLGAEKMDMDGMIDNIRTTSGAMAAVYMYGTADGRVKTSLRSNTDDIDVSIIAAKYGGGGHKRAAGCFMSLDMENNIREISEEFGIQLEKAGEH